MTLASGARLGPYEIVSPLKCLEKDRNLRYQHAVDIRTDLQRLKRETGSPRLAVGDEPGSAPGINRRWKVMVPATGAVLAVLVVGAYFLVHRPTTLTDKDTIVLADFDNKTGDPVIRCVRDCSWSFNNRRSSA